MKRTTVLLMTVFLIAGCGGTEQGGSRTGSQSDPQASESMAPASEPTAATSETSSATCGKSTSSEVMSTSESSTVIIHASSGEKIRVRVEVADNYFSRGLGLRYREHLPEDRGMLFAYTEEDERTFTMEDTVIPLSIAFMDSEGCILDIQDMKPWTNGYDSAKPAQYALEVNKGFFAERGVEVGDLVQLPS